MDPRLTGVAVFCCLRRSPDGRFVGMTLFVDEEPARSRNRDRDELLASEGALLSPFAVETVGSRTGLKGNISTIGLTTSNTVYAELETIVPHLATAFGDSTA